MNIYQSSIWLTYHEFSQMEDIYKFVSEWNLLLKNKKEYDFQQISYYKNVQSYVDEYFLTKEYNHLYAHFLLTIYSALEYDLCRLMGSKDYNYKNFSVFLKEKHVNAKQIRNIKDVNLLRLYCNAYKHNGGLYTNKIIKIKKDKNIGDEIQYSDLNITEQYDISYEFLFDLYGKLKR